MTYEIVNLPGHEVIQRAREIMRVYGAAFSMPPYNRTVQETSAFLETLKRHSERDGFRCFIAESRDDGSLIGFSYGYLGKPGQWWRDHVARAMDPQQRERWMKDYFEFVELAVLPSHQGMGIGGRLHDALLQNLPYRTALLSTYQGETAGFRLYQKRGWVTILQDFYFPGGSHPYRIMGLDLKTRKD